MTTNTFLGHVFTILSWEKVICPFYFSKIKHYIIQNAVVQMQSQAMDDKVHD